MLLLLLLLLLLLQMRLEQVSFWIILHSVCSLIWLIMPSSEMLLHRFSSSGGSCPFRTPRSRRRKVPEYDMLEGAHSGSQ